MESQLVKQANLSPNATAVIDNGFAVSYRELILRADTVADILEGSHLKLEEPVCILVEPGLHQLIAQIAVIRQGGTCVPIDPSVPMERLQGMLDDLATKHAITNDALSGRLPELNVIPIAKALDFKVETVEETEILLRAGCPENYRSHIVFTSGSTGRPKPIQILSGSILHALKHIPCGKLLPTDCASSLLNPGFDLALLELWKPLLEGATVVRVPDLVRTDTFALQEFVKEQHITFMVIPTALFEVISLNTPDAFCGTRHVIVAGDTVSNDAMQRVLSHSQPENVWNGYGPAEATILVTLGQVDDEEAQQSRISIGRTFGETKICLLDNDFKCVSTPGKTGEICIAGPQVSPGYLNRHDENEKSFITLDAEHLGSHFDSTTRLYRTGDLAQWRDQAGGVLDFIGRADTQVKISGYRVELGDIACAFESHPDIHSCEVLYHRQKEAEILEAYVVPVDWEKQVDSAKLLEWAKQKLPSYMVPSKVYKKRSFPLSDNGKVDRKALRPDDDGDEMKTNERGTPDQEVGQTDDSRQGLVSDERDMDLWLCNIIKEMLSSQKHGTKVTLQEIHRNPTVHQLVTFLNVAAGESKPGVPELEQWARDAKDLGYPLPLPDWQAPSEGRVFLTGATGFLGAHILQQLLTMETVKQIACLARSQAGLSASARIQQTLEQYDLWDGRLELTHKIMVLEGDLRHSKLGLCEEQFTWLTEWASVIFHVGAKVNWCDPYEAHYESNVVGMRNVLQTTTLGRRKALHYVSSIDVWSVSGFINNIERVFEDEPLMPHLNALPYDTGYSASQFVAEELLQRARACGLPAAIYRPGFIVGHSQIARSNANDYFSRLIMGCIQSGYFPDLDTQYLEYVTVDYVTSAILLIASKMDHLGRSYHIVPPDRSESVNYVQIHHMLQDLGYSVKKVDYVTWVEKIRESPGNALEAMMPLLEEIVYQDLTRLQTSKNTPIYDASNTSAVLKNRSDIAYVALNADLLQRFIHNWIDRGEFKLHRQPANF
ncbi:Linear gramicidin synthase subunit D [Penicillium rolfsii]|nr:Linear gramicidin synthase subunit D [Penicillium rolfsii]